MNVVERVEIDHFWENKRVEIAFSQDLNFLIGPNGSGKTTILNLIAAAFAVDLPTLVENQFSRLCIQFKATRSRARPSLTVEKKSEKDGVATTISYDIRRTASSGSVQIQFSDLSEERIVRERRYGRFGRFSTATERARDELKAISEISWLSVHRDSPSLRYDRAEGHETAVDAKVRHVSHGFANYFSLLSSRYNTRITEFQEYIFLSLLYKQRDFGKLVETQSEHQEERDEVRQILHDFGVRARHSEARVKLHFTAAEKASQAYKSGAFSVDDALALSDAFRMHEVVEEWRKLNSERKSIYEPRQIFEDIINSMFSRKMLRFDERNIPFIETTSGKQLSPQHLSSGEKQLYILLGEAILQERRPIIFMSDEPELSLHVAWQS